VGLSFFVLFGFIFAVGLRLLFPGTEPDSPAAIRATLVYEGLSQLLLFMLPALFFARIFHGSACAFFKTSLSATRCIVCLAAVCAVLLFLPANDWISEWNLRWDYGAMDAKIRSVSYESRAATERLFALSSMWDLGLQLLVAALIPAFCEEFFFRGAVQQLLGRMIGNVHMAVVATALVFSLAHGDLLGLLPRFVLGLLLGYLFLFSGSIWVSVCAHFFNNALVVVAYFLYHRGVSHLNPADPLLLPWTVVVPCLLSAGLLLAVYLVAPYRQGGSR